MIVTRMCKFNVLAFLMVSMFVIAPSVHAQNSSRALEQLSALNRINPSQNPEFESSHDVLKRKMLDRKNKVVGEVKDITIRANGTIDAIAVDFDRLRLGSTVYLGYRDIAIRSRADSYVLEMDSEEITDFYPQLLANIATASGDTDDVFSVRKINDIQVIAADGRRIGRVEDVLFSSSGGSVSALYVEISHGMSRGNMVAVPFRQANFHTKSGRLYAEVDNAMADAVLEFADE